MIHTRIAALLFLATPLALSAQQRPAPPVPTPVSEVPLTVTQPLMDTVDRVVAIVGSSAITWSDLAAAVNEQRAQGLELPPDIPGQQAIARQILSNLVDEEILVQKAHELKLEASETDIASDVDQRLRKVRAQFKSETEYKTELKNAGFGTPEEYRRTLFDQRRRELLQQKAYRELSKNAKPGSATEEEINSAYERKRADLAKSPGTISFRQLVIATHPSVAADVAARAKAESLLVKLKAGASFDELAKRESADPGSAKLGGDLGWNRRGSGFVPEFEAAMFRLAPGELSPVVKTSFGYHIIRVDRVQPAEVKVRHILIAPVIDSNDVQHTKLRADSAAQQWRAGVNFETLVAKYHDPSEEKGVLEPLPDTTLPASYTAALAGLKATQITEPFVLNTANGAAKYAIVQVVARTEPGEYSLPEIRELLRRQIAYEHQTRALLDDLRHQTYVSIRL